MQAKTILVPIDFSPSSDTALAMATSLARDSGAKLLIVHVEEPPFAVGPEYIYAIPERSADEIVRRLSNVKPADPKVPFEHRYVAGSPADAIVNTAKSEKVDMIVIGTHGRRGLTRLLLGSVAEAVVRNAPCPVLAVKQPNQPAANSHADLH